LLTTRAELSVANSVALAFLGTVLLTFGAGQMVVNVHDQL
jgi:hypothetical protein